MSQKQIKTEISLQYRSRETDTEQMIKRVQDDYTAHGNTAEITSIQLYIKPEDWTIYYVINDGIVGKISLF